MEGRSSAQRTSSQLHAEEKKPSDRASVMDTGEEPLERDASFNSACSRRRLAIRVTRIWCQWEFRATYNHGNTNAQSIWNV